MEIEVAGLLGNTKKRLIQFWQRYSRNGAAVAGVPVILFIMAGAILAPWITRFSPQKLGAESLSPPSSEHLMGTDDLGRDIFSGIVYGARTSLAIGFLAAAVSAIIGTVLGALSGFFGGMIDNVLMRLTEIFMTLPTIVVALVVSALFGSSVLNIILVIGILSWPTTARLVRAEFLSLRERDFVLAAKAMGVSNREIIFNEMLPNATAPIVVSTSLQIGRAIIVESGLSFLGLGDPNVMTWGRMIGNAQYFLRYAWWMAVFPGIALSLTVIALNLIGDGLNDALNPRLREGYG